MTVPIDAVTIDRMTPADAPRCAQLEAVLFPGDDPWTAEMFTAELAAAHNHYLAARQDGRLVGYAGIARLGPPAHPEHEVHTIGVDPAHQCRGTGAVLLDALLAHADAVGGPVFLEVRTDNTPAQELYVRNGFRVVGTRKGYYSPSGADAHTMKRELLT